MPIRSPSGRQIGALICNALPRPHIAADLSAVVSALNTRPPFLHPAAGRVRHKHRVSHRGDQFVTLHGLRGGRAFDPVAEWRDDQETPVFQRLATGGTEPQPAESPGAPPAGGRAGLVESPDGLSAAACGLAPSGA